MVIAGPQSRPGTLLRTLCRYPWGEIPLHPFKGRIYTPTFTANGMLHADPGYDRDTGLYFSAIAGLSSADVPCKSDGRRNCRSRSAV